MTTRIRKILGWPGEEPVRYHQQDVDQLKKEIPVLSLLSNSRVEDLYSEFSDTRCARWLIVSYETIEQFKEWLTEEV